MPTVRNVLAGISPHVSSKVAWRETIRMLRIEKKAGRKPILGALSDVHRLLAIDANSAMDLPSLKELLRQVVQEETVGAKVVAAVYIDSWAKLWLPRITKAEVEISISGWPSWLEQDERSAISGFSSDRFKCTPPEAAQLYHHLHGLNIGGATITLSHVIPDGETLPSITRKHRARKRERGHTPWLPHLDEEGRISATPESLAMMHGEILRSTSNTVIDAFCGLGGDTIGAALSGCSVFSIERDPERLQLAKANARHFGVLDKITFFLGDALEHTPRLLGEHPNAAVFLDPPWGGIDWGRETMSFEVLFGNRKELWDQVFGACPILLKLPRTFDTTSLPTQKTQWKFQIGRLEAQTSPADRVRIVTALHIPTPS
jgi:hypothetical protein